MKSNLIFDFTVDKENKTIHVARRFDAEVPLVWQAWTTPELLDQWWGPEPWRAETKSMDFRVGGHWLYAMVGPEGEKHWSKVSSKLYKANIKDACLNSVKFILSKNIVRGDALTLNKVDSPEPIVFAEWSALNGSMIKRRDFTLTNLLKAEAAKGENDLFSGTYETDPAFLPRAIADYPLTHFLKLSESELPELEDIQD